MLQRPGNRDPVSGQHRAYRRHEPGLGLDRNGLCWTWTPEVGRRGGVRQSSIMHAAVRT